MRARLVEGLPEALLAEVFAEHALHQLAAFGRPRTRRTLGQAPDAVHVGVPGAVQGGGVALEDAGAAEGLHQLQPLVQLLDALTQGLHFVQGLGTQQLQAGTGRPARLQAPGGVRKVATDAGGVVGAGKADVAGWLAPRDRVAGHQAPGTVCAQPLVKPLRWPDSGCPQRRETGVAPLQHPLRVDGGQRLGVVVQGLLQRSGRGGVQRNGSSRQGSGLRWWRKVDARAARRGTGLFAGLHTRRRRIARPARAGGRPPGRVEVGTDRCLHDDRAAGGSCAGAGQGRDPPGRRPHPGDVAAPGGEGRRPSGIGARRAGRPPARFGFSLGGWGAPAPAPVPQWRVTPPSPGRGHPTTD